MSASASAPTSSSVRAASEAPSAAESLPDQPDPAAVEKVIASAAKSLNQCAEPGRGTVQINISVEPAGTALTSFATGAAGGTLPDDGGVRACLSVVLEELAFPRSRRGLRIQRMFTMPMKVR